MGKVSERLKSYLAYFKERQNASAVSKQFKVHICQTSLRSQQSRHLLIGLSEFFSLENANCCLGIRLNRKCKEKARTFYN